MDEKQCKHCGETKLVTEFYRSKSNKGGRRTWCKSCTNERHQAWEEANRDRVNAGLRERYWRAKVAGGKDVGNG